MIPPSASTIRRGRANPTAERGEGRVQAYVVNGIARDLELARHAQDRGCRLHAFPERLRRTTRYGIGHTGAILITTRHE